MEKKYYWTTNQTTFEEGDIVPVPCVMDHKPEDKEIVLSMEVNITLGYVIFGITSLGSIKNLELTKPIELIDDIFELASAGEFVSIIVCSNVRNENILPTSMNSDAIIELDEEPTSNDLFPFIYYYQLNDIIDEINGKIEAIYNMIDIIDQFKSNEDHFDEEEEDEKY